MSGMKGKTLAVVLLTLLATNLQATCINRENTSIPESTPTSQFSIHPDGTLTAPATGLMWTRCLVGQSLSDNVCQGEPTRYDWTQAFVAANAADIAGYSDWRLPNPKELLSIFEDRCADPALNAELFPISGNFGAWTATPSALLFLDLYDEAWFFNGNGVLRRTSALAGLPILLVRNLP